MTSQPSIELARAALREHFGHPDFRKGQAEIIGSVLAGHDTLAVLPTGGGKSICYQIPALLLPRLTLVLSPLISLMTDQVEALVRRGIAASFINSSLEHAEIAERLTRARAGALRILYAAPERLDHSGIAGRLREAGVSLLAVDEAHCISEWGHDFRPSYLRMHGIRAELGLPPVIALTATATPRVRRDILNCLRLVNPTVVVTGFDRGNLRYRVQAVAKRGEREAALLALTRACSQPTIIYASTRRSVEHVVTLLRRNGVAAGAYHAGMHQSRRQTSQSSFMRGRTRVLVATNAFGMGIDKPDVRLVIHHSMPGTLEAYYQEAGRAGRDGGASECVLLFAYSDRFTHEYFINARIPHRDVAESAIDALAGARDSSGLIPASWVTSEAARLSAIPRGELAASVAACLQHGILESVAPSRTEVRIRLLATSTRIASALSSREREPELQLLRALWRLAGPALERGVVVNLGNLRSRWRYPRSVRSVLTQLQSEQFIIVESIGEGWRMVNSAPHRKIEAMLVSLDLRRRAESGRLLEMQRYAQTDGCRRAFLLRYFGDAFPEANCGGCDNCLHKQSATIAQAATQNIRSKARQLRMRL